MRTRLRSKSTLLFVVFGLLLAIPAIALADIIVVDGDYISTANPADGTYDNPVNLGTVAPGATIQKTARFKLVCHSKNHVDLGNTVFLTVSPNQTDVYQNANFSQLAPTGGVSVVTTKATNDQQVDIGPIPTSWPDDASTANCDTTPQELAATHTAAITVTAPNTAGTYFGRARFSQTLAQNDNQAVSGGSNTDIIYNMTVDATAPETTILTGPSGTVNSASATFTFSSNEANSTFETRLDNGTWEANGTATSKTYNSLSNASHTFDVRATDPAGNVDQSPASRSWTVQTDSTPPVITKTISGTQGSNDWYKSDVTVTWSVNDPDCAVVIDSGCGTQDFTSNTASATSSCTAHSAGGTATDSVTLKIDMNGPTANATPSRSDDQGGWYNHAFTVNFSGTDVGPSGNVSCSPTSTTYGDDVSETDGTGKSVSSTCTDGAGNTATGRATFKIDLSNPLLNITGAASGTTYTACGAAPTKPTFSPFDAISGLDGSQGDSWDVPTTGVDTYTYTAHARDNAGRTTSETRTYTRTYGSAYTGLLQPINAGSTPRW
jgi:large repetitive protein